MKQRHTALTRSTQVVTRETRTHDLLAESTSNCKNRIMWIDGVGGFLLVDREEVLIGQAIDNCSVDVCIIGDLSRQAAALRRNEGDYLLQPLQEMLLDGRPVDRPQLLSDGAIVQLGRRVKLQFTKPSPLSATAKIELTSVNRFKPNVDAVLLLADSCILGPNAGSHVYCSGWTNELLMFRQGDEWFFRTLVDVSVDGEPTKGHIPLVAGMRMDGEDFSLSIE